MGGFPGSKGGSAVGRAPHSREDLICAAVAEQIYCHGTSSFELLLQHGTYAIGTSQSSRYGESRLVPFVNSSGLTPVTEDDPEFLAIQKNLYALCLNEVVQQ